MRRGACTIVRQIVAVFCALMVTAGPLLPATAAAQEVVTPMVPFELPVEVETELSPAGSLKQVPLWKELLPLLQNPGAQRCVPAANVAGQECVATTPRRPGFGVTMPPLNVYSVCFNVLTGQPMRRRTVDGEISWDQPGLLYDPDETVQALDTNGDGAPDRVRTPIGSLVADRFKNLLVSNPFDDPRIPPDGTAVAVPVCDAQGRLLGDDGLPVSRLDAPMNETDFLRLAIEAGSVSAPLRPYIGRRGAEVLGKALFWDMQVGSDGVQACGTCHFHAGVDNRTRNQLNPGQDSALQVRGPNDDVQAADFPFHKLLDPDIPGEPRLNPGNVARDSDDVLSSMGVSRFKRFVDIPAIGTWLPAVNGVRALPPDIGTLAPDPVPSMEGLRRIEPRNTPTFHAAAFNFDNFWDGRARFHFNGGSVFGASDPQFHVFIDPFGPGAPGGTLRPANNGHIRPEMIEDDEEIAAQPLRIKFSSLASQAVGPPLSDFEMSFAGRNWPKIGKKLLQAGVTPLANQRVAVTDSILGPFSNQGGALCGALGRQTAANRPGLCVSYDELVRLGFKPSLWHNDEAASGRRHLNGAPAICTTTDVEGHPLPAGCDPFDGYVLALANGAANPGDTNQFRQIEANFSLFFALAVQMYEQLTIPDDTPFDRFMDVNPRAGNGVGQPGEQATLPPDQVPALVGALTLIPDNPATPEYDGFGPDELFGFDIFAGANLTAALPRGHRRNPTGAGSNPFLRSARCMICHLGPEQTDHTSNVAHGLILSDTEFELPPPGVAEPTGPFRTVTGLMLAEEVEEVAQDAVEVENRNFSLVRGTLAGLSYPGAILPFAREIGLPSAAAFQDNGIYNIGLRPTAEDSLRGGKDPWGWPFALAALALKNLAGPEYEPCDGTPGERCSGPISRFDPSAGFGGGLFEETGGGETFFGTDLTLQSVNPGLKMEPAEPLMPDYMAPWLNNLPAGELHPQIDELAFAPNTISHPPAPELAEIQFGADLHCVWDPVTQSWGPRCPNTQSAVPNNFDPNLSGTWPISNRLARKGAAKAPQLRNVELTGPYFHTGSYLTLRQVVDFYMRGGDFPLTNADDRDPNMVDVNRQAFGFGSTSVLTPLVLDGIPDEFALYDAMPDTDQPTTPEPPNQPEDAKVALVKFLLSLTDPRVKYERAPFDHPEIFVPIDGAAPENTGGRTQLAALSGVACGAGSTGTCFEAVPAVGAEGRANGLPNFLGIASRPRAGTDNDHFDR